MITCLDAWKTNRFYTAYYSSSVFKCENCNANVRVLVNDTNIKKAECPNCSYIIYMKEKNNEC